MPSNLSTVRRLGLTTPTASRSARSASRSGSAAPGRPRDSPAARAVAEAHRRQAAMRNNLRAAAEAYADAESDDDGADSASPIIDRFVGDNGRSAYKAMTMFTEAEFERLWSIVGSSITAAFSTGRGPKCNNTPKDVFFIMMNVVHTPTKWEKHGIDFSMKGPTLEKQVWKMMKIAGPILKAHFQKQVSMAELRAKGFEFKNFPYAHHATDVHFIHTNRPTGTFEEARPSFSGKHHLYGIKYECSVLPDGQACNWTQSYRGGEHDKDICLDNLRYHRKATKKTAAERATVDHGEGAVQHPNHWAILEDKAYIGIQGDIRAILPTKRKPRRGYTQAEYERNVEQSSDRVIVENFFGRASQIGGIIAQKYVWSRERADTVVDIVFSLTNYHILLHPLRAADGEYYERVMADLKRKADEAKTKGARRQREYRQRQASVQAALEGMDDDFTDDDGDEEEDDGRLSSDGGLGSGFGGGLSSGGEEEEELSDDEDDDDDDGNGRFARRQAESVSQGRRIVDNTLGGSSSSASYSSSSSDESSSSDDDDGIGGAVAAANNGNETGAGTDADGDEDHEEEDGMPPTPTRKSGRKRNARERFSP